MSESISFEPLPMHGAKQTPRVGFVALFKAALESLVAAQRSRFEVEGPLMYRFPPL
jgi:hypothetical protein